MPANALQITDPTDPTSSDNRLTQRTPRRDFGTQFEKDEPTEPDTSTPVPELWRRTPRLEQWLAEQRAKNAAKGQGVVPMAQPPPMTWAEQLSASRPADYSVDPRMQTAAPAFKIWRGGTTSLPAAQEQPPQYPWRNPYEQGT